MPETLEVNAAATLRQLRGDFPSVGFFFFAGGAGVPGYSDAKVTIVVTILRIVVIN